MNLNQATRLGPTATRAIIEFEAALARLQFAAQELEASGYQPMLTLDTGRRIRFLVPEDDAIGYRSQAEAQQEAARRSQERPTGHPARNGKNDARRASNRY